MSLEDAKRAGIDTSATLAPSQSTKPTIQSVTRVVPDEEDEDLKAAIAASLKEMENKKDLGYPSVQSNSITSIKPEISSAQYQVRCPADFITKCA